MSRIAWTEQMSVGVPEIDRQHQRLIDLFNGLDEGLVRGSASRLVRGLFAELASYTKYHFGREANLLRLDGYAGLPAHLAAHDEFTAKVADLEPLLQREGGEAAAIETNRFLRGWILRHIVVVDRLAFARYRARGAGASAAAQPGPAASPVDATSTPAEPRDAAPATAAADADNVTSSFADATLPVAVDPK
jgi:hemerythrin